MKNSSLNFAILRIAGKQYKVKERDEILVYKVDKPKFDVLLAYLDGKLKIGKPVVKDVEIKFKVLEPEIKGEKIKVLKYKAKSRYRRRKGHTTFYTKILIESIKDKRVS